MISGSDYTVGDHTIVTLSFIAVVMSKHLPYSPFSCFEHKAWKIYLKSAFPSGYMLGGAQEKTCPHLNRAVSGNKQSTTALVHLGRAVEHCRCENASWSLYVPTFGRLIMTSYLKQGYFYWVQYSSIIRLKSFRKVNC